MRIGRLTLRAGWRQLFAVVALMVTFAPAGAQITPFGKPGDKTGRVSATPKRVTVSALASKPQARAGDQLAIAVTLQYAPGWHSWTNPPIVPDFLGKGFPAIPTTIDLGKSDAVAQVGPVQWPEPHTVPFLSGELTALTGTAVAYIPVILASDISTESVSLPVTVRFQACNDKVCLPPASQSLAVSIEILPQGAPTTAATDPERFADFDIAVFQHMLAGDIKADRAPVEFNAFGYSFSIDPAGAGFALLLAVAALGGLLLNLTPCVLPVIPIKIMGLAHSAGNPRRALFLGAVMSLGVIAFWMGIGGAIAFVSGFSAINSLFQQPLFSLAVGLVIAAMGLGMLGLFTFQLPKAVYMFNPSHDTVVGSFLFGVMTAVLSTPCTAPFMGSAAAWATKQPPVTTLATFGAIGLGMALPYLVLSANPKLVDRIPKAGPTGEVVKQTMGLLMFAVAAFFVGIGVSSLVVAPPEPPSRVYWWFVGAFVALAFAFAGWRTRSITKRSAPRFITALVAVLAIAGAVWGARAMSSHGPIDWLYYTPERFKQARATGDVVVVDFTAEWCLNCKALETGVLHRKKIVSLLEGPGVTPIKVDLTAGDPAGKAKLDELGRIAIPLLAIYGPGIQQPILYDSYTIDMIVDAIAQAKGQPEAQSGE